MEKYSLYLKVGAALGFIAGSAYGIYDGLQQTDNGFFEALHNMLSKDPNLFTTEFWVMTKDGFIGLAAGLAAGGLGALVHSLYSKVRGEAPTPK